MISQSLSDKRSPEDVKEEPQAEGRVGTRIQVLMLGEFKQEELGGWSSEKVVRYRDRVK